MSIQGDNEESQCQGGEVLLRFPPRERRQSIIRSGVERSIYSVGKPRGVNDVLRLALEYEAFQMASLLEGDQNMHCIPYVRVVTINFHGRHDVLFF